MPIIIFILHIPRFFVNLTRRPLPADRRLPLTTRSILWSTPRGMFVLEVA